MDSNDDPSPFFPPELEREIFETAAELYPKTILNLLLVAQRVHEWIEIIRYSIVSTIDDPSSCPIHVLQQAIRSNAKPADFFQRVRHLYVEKLVPETELQEIISACIGIRSLVLFHGGPSILPGLATIKPRRLSVSLECLFPDQQSLDLITIHPKFTCLTIHPILTCVTHLDLFDDLSQIRWINLLPALTHFALLRRKPSAWTELLSANAKLAVIIRMQSSEFRPENRISNDDVRFVCMSVLDADYGPDWLTGVKGGMDFWARADLFVAKKRRGEIKPSSRCWIEAEDGI
ncbi:hypothetical protein DFH09DRAFT_1356456 [Mycena vulgaris]|nr:hypothetical protein DFH09DRAFT_1356456 [Mycena vulgaris]